MCVFVWGLVDCCVVVVGDGHHRFCNFNLESSDIDEEFKKVVVFSHLKGVYYVQMWGNWYTGGVRER